MPVAHEDGIAIGPYACENLFTKPTSAVFRGDRIFSNAAMTPRMIRIFCKIDTASERMLETAMQRIGLSARAYDRILKVSRTIADLEGSEKITTAHVSEAVGYRSLDRTYWT